MLGKTNDQPNLFLPLLESYIDMKNELVLLANKIDWNKLEEDCSHLYSKTKGRPSMPIRFMFGCLVLKHLFNYGDETLAVAWVQNPYFQYFTGELHFKHAFPCDPSDLVHFRHRIGEDGIKRLFDLSVELNGKSSKEKVVVSDTTVQGSNITYPTDTKLCKKVIMHCNKIAKEERVKLRQSYTRTSSRLLLEAHGGRSPMKKKVAKKAVKKLKTLAGRQVRDLGRKLGEDYTGRHQETLKVMQQIVEQERNDKGKIYSIHKPWSACIAKGKLHRPYEFGSKVGLVVSARSQVITAIMSFEGNVHDSKTIAPLIDDMEIRLGELPKELVYDRGGRGKKEIKGVKILTPGRGSKDMSEGERRRLRGLFRRRAGIETVIGHLKSDHRMGENYLYGRRSPQINASLAAIAWNLKKIMRKLKEKVIKFIFWLLGIFQHSDHKFAPSRTF